VSDDPAIHLLDQAHPLATGPGVLGRDGVPGAVLWRAGSGARDVDLFGGFWRDEAPGIDWLTGYLCDGDTIRLMARLGEPESEEEEDEEMYARASMNTLESSIDSY
jgi:hypothetical protein